MSINRLATRLLYPLARWLRSWADGVLANEKERAEPAASRQLAVTPTEARDSLSVPETGPPAHWLSRVSSAAPAHWVERVQNAAPELPRVVERENTEPTAGPPRTTPSVKPIAPLRLEQPRAPVSSFVESLADSPVRGSKPGTEVAESTDRVDPLHAQKGEESERVEKPERSQARIDDQTEPRPLGQAQPQTATEYSGGSSTFGANRQSNVAQPRYEQTDRQAQRVRRIPQRSQQGTSSIRATATQPPEINPASQVSPGQEQVREKSAVHPLSLQVSPPPAANQAISPAARYTASQSKRGYALEGTDGTTAKKRRADESSPAPTAGYSMGARAAMTEAWESSVSEIDHRFSAIFPPPSPADPWPELPRPSEVRHGDEIAEALRVWARRRKLEREQTGSIWSE